MPCAVSHPASCTVEPLRQVVSEALGYGRGGGGEGSAGGYVDSTCGAAVPSSLFRLVDGEWDNCNVPSGSTCIQSMSSMFYGWGPHLSNWICDWPNISALVPCNRFQRSAVWSCLNPAKVILRAAKIERKAASECNCRLRAEYLSTVHSNLLSERPKT